MSSDDGKSRSERLRRRRRQSSESAQQSETSEQSQSSKPSDTSVKDEQVGTYMYLPEEQKKNLDRLYNVLKAEYEYEFDREFEKNRHFFPLVVQYGLDNLDGLDASEIQSRLESI